MTLPSLIPLQGPTRLFTTPRVLPLCSYQVFALSCFLCLWDDPHRASRGSPLITRCQLRWDPLRQAVRECPPDPHSRSLSISLFHFNLYRAWSYLYICLSPLISRMAVLSLQGSRVLFMAVHQCLACSMIQYSINICVVSKWEDRTLARLSFVCHCP